MNFEIGILLRMANNDETWDAEGIFDYGLRAGAIEIAMLGPQGDLWRACADVDIQNIQKAIREGADMDARGPQGETPRMVAAAASAKDCSDSWLRGGEMERAFCEAARLASLRTNPAHQDVLEIETGPAKDSAGRVFMDWLMLAQLQEADRGIPRSDEDAGRRLRMAIDAGGAGKPRAERLLARWVGRDAKWLIPGLLVAARKDLPEMLMSMLSLHRRMSRRPEAGRWRPPGLLLKAAAEHGSIACIEELLKAGASVDGKDGANAIGSPPLARAVWNMHWAAAKVLIKAGADIEWRDAHRSTLLMRHIDRMGRANDGMETLAHLLDLGADPLRRRAKRQGDSAIDIAKKLGHSSAAELMTSWSERRALQAMLESPMCSEQARPTRRL